MQVEVSTSKALLSYGFTKYSPLDLQVYHESRWIQDATFHQNDRPAACHCREYPGTQNKLRTP